MYSLFIALQPTTKERNGVTFTYPDSHRLFVWDTDEDDVALDDVDHMLDDTVKNTYQRCEPPLNAGDGFIYSSQTHHAANANPSNSARMMFLIGFQSGEKRKGEKCQQEVCQEGEGAGGGGEVRGFLGVFQGGRVQN